jgi:uncharacterized protein YdeI (YjbR/CyaY-like superfamily)
MKPTKTLHVTDRVKWRRWLAKNHKTAEEIWLIYFKASTGKPRIAYNDAVEEALCFGWIDSTVKKLNGQRFAQRFSRRNPKSGYSQANKERLRRLIAAGRVAKEVLATLGEMPDETFEIPKDILAAIKSNGRAWSNFQGYSDAYKRIRIGFIEGARNRPEEFKKRLKYFIRMTEKGKQFGFGGIEKYY